MDPQWLLVNVHPHAKRDVLITLGPGRFEAWVTPKPLGGRANEAVVNLLRHHLQIPRGRLQLMKGGSGRHKVFKMLG